MDKLNDNKTPYSGVSAAVAKWAEQTCDCNPGVLSSTCPVHGYGYPASVPEQLPDFSQELASLGRGSLQNRAELLTQLLLSLEEELSYIDRPYTTRVDVCRGLIQDARRAGILKARAR